MILNERDARHEHILQVARQMMTAARTAPKGKGIDIIEVALITDEEIKQLSDTMIAMVEEHGMKFFLRDADNILSAECVVLIVNSGLPSQVHFTAFASSLYDLVIISTFFATIKAE